MCMACLDSPFSFFLDIPMQNNVYIILIFGVGDDTLPGIDLSLGK